MKKENIPERAVEFILTRNTEELANIKDVQVAECIGVDFFELYRKFKAVRGMSLQDFILREKLYRAYFVLKNNFKKSIKELSEELGFLKIDDFNSEFLKFFAVLPERFRNLNKKKGALLSRKCFKTHNEKVPPKSESCSSTFSKCL